MPALLVAHPRFPHLQDVRTLVVCPAKTVQRQLNAEELLKSGAPDDLVRVSVGLEHIDDIIAGKSTFLCSTVPRNQARTAQVTYSACAL